MNKIWFMKKELLVGGTELLIERVGRDLQKKDFSIGVIYSTVTEDIERRYLKLAFSMKQISSWDDSKSYRFLCTEEKQGVITFSVEDFCNIYTNSFKNIKTILYTVYFNQLLIGGKTKGKWGLDAVKILTGSLLSILMKANNIVCMDEHTIHNTYEYYGNNLKIKQNDIRIVRIPVDIVDFNCEILNERARRKDKIKILTIARADFPWKGYMFGLINYVRKYGVEKNLYLHIVTYGPGESEIVNFYNGLEENIKARITIQGKTEYEALELLYCDSVVYVGQGTTVLDAAQRGLLTVPVVPDTYEVISDDFFHDDPTRVTVLQNVDDKFDSLIDSIMNMTCEEYIEKAKLGRRLTEDNYSTENVCNQLFEVLSNVQNNSKKIWQVECFNMLKKIKKLLKV